MLRYFDLLGARIERAWADIDRDEGGFPEIAMDALGALPPESHLDVEALIDAMLDPARATPRQLAPLGAFGQPGVTAHHGRGFVVDVYFWNHSLSAIHDHPFCGAFVVLRGFSVHGRYRFEEERRLSHRARLGALSLEALELVEEGHAEPFGREPHGLIHALLHVPLPSVSMVVRTVRTVGYLRYFPPGVAIAMDPPDDAIERPMMLLDTLRACADPSYAGRLEAFLSTADFETTFRCLSRHWGACEDEERGHLLELATARHGEGASRIAAALDAATIAQEADALRAGLRDPDERLIATALVLADRRAAVLSLLGARHPDPVARLHRFVDEVGLFGPDDEPSRILARALVDGEGEAGAVARLVAAYGSEAVEEEAVHAYCARGPFSPLRR